VHDQQCYYGPLKKVIAVQIFSIEVDSIAKSTWVNYNNLLKGVYHVPNDRRNRKSLPPPAAAQRVESADERQRANSDAGDESLQQSLASTPIVTAIPQCRLP
jgi:hypothetical protein